VKGEGKKKRRSPDTPTSFPEGRERGEAADCRKTVLPQATREKERKRYGTSTPVG